MGSVQPETTLRTARLVLILTLVLGSAWSSTRTVSSAAATAAQPTAATFPGDTWQRVPDPTKAGWSKAGLDSVQALISRMNSSAMVVVEHGKIVYSYGDLTAQSYLASVRKSILSMLYGIEIARGPHRHIEDARDARHRRPRRAPAAREGGDRPGLVRRPVGRVPHRLVRGRLPGRGAAARVAEARHLPALLQLGLQRPRDDLRAGDEAEHLRRARAGARAPDPDAGLPARPPEEGRRLDAIDPSRRTRSSSRRATWRASGC